MAKKDRLGSDPLSFIKDTRAGTEKAEAKPREEDPVKEEKIAAKDTDVKKETVATDIIKAEKLSMHVKNESSGRVLISFDGEMSIYNVRQIKDSLVESIRKNSGIELDLSKVNKIDTAGYQIIMAAKKEAAGKGKSIRVINPASEVKNIFKLYGESLQ